MTVLDEAIADLRDALDEVAWMPTRYTPSLTGDENFITDGDRLIRVVEKHWREESVPGKFLLEDWQKWLIRHALERYPADWPVEELRGRLRYRQLLITMGRQNGKSILGAIFGVYGLLFHEPSPKVLGVAYSKVTAGVVYDRVAWTLRNVPLFSKAVKVTKTSGIRRIDKPGEYHIKPNSEKAIQGFPISLCIYDEVHITTEKLWSAAKQGTKNFADGLVIGITTAGDDTSSLLKSLYKQGQDAIDNPGDQDLQRFGFFCWEAPEGSTLDDDDAIRAANPAVASGRIPISRVRTDAKTDPETEQQRYVLNRFVAATNSWIDLSVWNKCAGTGLTIADRTGPVTYGVDSSANMEYVTITANRTVDGKVKTTTIASLVRPTKESLLERCLVLARKGNARFVMDGYILRWLGDELKKRGIKTFILSLTEVSEACATFYRLIIRGELETSNEPVLRNQVPRGVRKNWGDQWRISRQHSGVEIDALMATCFGAYLADRREEDVIQVF